MHRLCPNTQLAILDNLPLPPLLLPLLPVCHCGRTAAVAGLRN
jgi:hypothetical protein